MKWEYRTLSTTDRDWENNLNELGTYGWEAYAVTYTPNSNEYLAGKRLYYLKRQIK